MPDDTTPPAGAPSPVEPPVLRDQVRREADAVEHRAPLIPADKEERKRQARAYLALVTAGGPTLLAMELAAATYQGWAW